MVRLRTSRRYRGGGRIIAPGGGGGGGGGSSSIFLFNGNNGDPLPSDFNTYNEAGVPDVQQWGGDAIFPIVNNDNDKSLWYLTDQGRGDGFRFVQETFDVVAYRMGICRLVDNATVEEFDPASDTWDTSVAPVPGVDLQAQPFCGSGLIAHIDTMATQSYQFISAGHRGTAHHTLEYKNSENGSNSIQDAGDDALGEGVTWADLRVIGTYDDGEDTFDCVFWHRAATEGEAQTATALDTTGWTEGGHTTFFEPTFTTAVRVLAFCYAFGGQSHPILGFCEKLEILAGTPAVWT